MTTFDIRPTAANIAPGETVDELMIDWGKTKSSGLAQIYLPAISATRILQMATRMYSPNTLTQIDDYTIGCPVGGISYIPIPSGSAANYAGLLTINMPPNLRRDGSYQVVVRQVTNASKLLAPPPPVPPVPQIARAGKPAATVG